MKRTTEKPFFFLLFFKNTINMWYKVHQCSKELLPFLTSPPDIFVLEKNGFTFNTSVDERDGILYWRDSLK